jgi:DNA-binding NarL/FixJ family response regulator
MHAIVADDHPMVRQAVADMLRCRFGEHTRVVGVGTYDGLLVALEMGPADVVIADLDMPDLGPFRNLASVLRKAGDRPVAIFSSSQAPPVVRSALRQGARAYVCKSDAPDRLLDAVEAVLSGGTYVDPALLDAPEAAAPAGVGAPVPATNVAALRRATAPDRRPAPSQPCLTPRQREILCCVGQGLSNKQIARRLGISDSTVKVHMHGLFERLGVENRTQAALAAGEERAAAPFESDAPADPDARLARLMSR